MNKELFRMENILCKHPVSFAEKMLVKEGGAVRYIEAMHNNEPCWYFLKLNPNNYSIYKLKRRNCQVMIKDFGDVILCGWGKHAPEIAKRIMRKRYSTNC